MRSPAVSIKQRGAPLTQMVQSVPRFVQNPAGPRPAHRGVPAHQAPARPPRVKSVLSRAGAWNGSPARRPELNTEHVHPCERFQCGTDRQGCHPAVARTGPGCARSARTKQRRIKARLRASCRHARSGLRIFCLIPGSCCSTHRSASARFAAVPAGSWPPRSRAGTAGQRVVPGPTPRSTSRRAGCKRLAPVEIGIGLPQNAEQAGRPAGEVVDDGGGVGVCGADADAEPEAICARVSCLRRPSAAG
jgi:hypothetical protein